MKKTILIISLVIGVAVAAAWAIDVDDGEKLYSWRYKITVEIETPEGIKTGSAVREMNILFKPRPLYRPDPYHASFKMRGEAVAVDLGKRGVVFALITPDSYPEITKTFPGPPALTIKGAEYYSNLKDVKAFLKPSQYPRLVSFTDMSDPKSVVNIKGSEFDIDTQKNYHVDNFEKVFGKGVKLKSITVEMTREKITWGVVDTYLPENFQRDIKDRWKELSFQDRHRIQKLTTFKTGEY